jgi:hypothetical protein
MAKRLAAGERLSSPRPEATQGQHGPRYAASFGHLHGEAPSHGAAGEMGVPPRLYVIDQRG